MDPRRLSAGEWVTAAAGVLLLVSLFLTWYRPGVSAWEAFSVADLLFAVTGLLGAAGWITAAADRTNATSVALQSLTLLVAGIAAVVALYRLIDPPGDGALERAAGAWLGSAAVAGVLGGTVLAMRDEGPARRDPETERRAEAEALRRAELIPLPGDGEREQDTR